MTRKHSRTPLDENTPTITTSEHHQRRTPHTGGWVNLARMIV